MIIRKQRRAERLRHEVLKKPALDFDVDPERDYARPGNSPPERAFHLLSCAFDLLIEIADRGFPSTDRRTRERGGKWIHQGLLFSGWPPTQFLGHAIPALYAAAGGRLGDSDHQSDEGASDPELHRNLRKAVQDFHPLSMKPGVEQEAKRPRPHGKRTRRKVVFRHLLDECLAEFAVMEKRQPREEVARGDEPASEYSQALLRGEDPDQDPQLVELQRRYARDYFVNIASLHGVEFALDDPDFYRLSGKLTEVLDPADPSVSEYRARMLDAWTEGTRRYREYALIESRSRVA